MPYWFVLNVPFNARLAFKLRVDMVLLDDWTVTLLGKPAVAPIVPVVVAVHSLPGALIDVPAVL